MSADESLTDSNSFLTLSFEFVAVNIHNTLFLRPNKEPGLWCRGSAFQSDMAGRMHPDKLVGMLAFPLRLAEVWNS